MADLRFPFKRSGIFQPLIEPAQQNRVRVDQRLGTEVRRPDAIPPRNVHPGPGQQVLIFARKFAARGFTQGEKAVDAAAKKNVIPAGNVQCRNENFFETRADVERGPVFAGRIVIEPVEHIGRQAFAVQGRMLADGQDARLRRELRPGLFEPVASFAQPLPPRVLFQ